MIDVEISIEPPVLQETAEEEERLHVSVSITEHDGTVGNAAMVLPGHRSDRQIADALIRCVRGASVVRGPGLAAAVEGRLR